VGALRHGGDSKSETAKRNEVQSFLTTGDTNYMFDGGRRGRGESLGTKMTCHGKALTQL